MAGGARRSSLWRSLSCWRVWWGSGGAVTLTLSRQHGRQPDANFPPTSSSRDRPPPTLTRQTEQPDARQTVPQLPAGRDNKTATSADRIAGNPPGEPQDPGATPVRLPPIASH